MTPEEARKIFESKKLMLLNEQEWWYAKGFLEGIAYENKRAEGLVEALDHIWKKYDSHPDGLLGAGFVNGDFFKVREALETYQNSSGRKE